MIAKQSQPVDEKRLTLEIGHALIALEYGATDRSILQYLNFLVRVAPIKELSFLHVLPIPDFWDALAEEDTEQDESVQARAQLLEEIKSKTLEKLDIKENIKTYFGIRQGSPLEELLEEARTINADLIVTGLSTSRGSHGILAKTLARNAESNTLIVPDLSEPTLSNILVPVDFSAHSARALKSAVALNNQLTLPAKITCLHVFDFPDAPWYKIQRTREEILKMIEQNRKEALLQFLNLEIPDYHDSIDIRLIPKMRPSVGSYVMETADETSADLIVIGARGHSHIARLLIGSVTEKVLAMTTQIPVLVVK